MRKLFIYTMLSVVSQFFMADLVFAKITIWTNSSPSDNLWSNSGNWSNGLPNSTDTALVTKADSNCLINSSVTNAQVYDLQVECSVGTSYVDITGGSLTSAWRIVLGLNSSRSGVINMSGGTVNVNPALWVGKDGSGTLNMTGGTLSALVWLAVPASMGAGTGHVQLNDGVINAGGFQSNGNGTIDIEQGTLILDGTDPGVYPLSIFKSFLDAGKVTAYGGTGTVNVDYGNINPGRTTVTASPNGVEPPGTYTLGDFDEDGYVNLIDLGILGDYWLTSCIADANDCNGTDIAPPDGDGSVDFQDYVLWAKNWYNPPRTSFVLSDQAGHTIWVQNPVEKVYKDSSLPTLDANSVQIKAARNEYEPFQLVITPDAAWSDVNLAFSDLTGPGTISKDSLYYYRVEYVNITSNTTSQPNVPLEPIGWTPDPLPLETSSDLSAGENNPFWVTLKVPADANAGIYTGNIYVKKAGVLVDTIPLTVEIWDFSIPPETEHNVLINCNSWADMSDLGVIENVSAHRATVKFLPDITCHIDGSNNVTIDTNSFDASAPYIIDTLGNEMFQFPHMGFVSGHDWPTDQNNATWYGYKYYATSGSTVLTPDVQNVLGQWVTRVSQHLAANGWLDYAYVKFCDEMNGGIDKAKGVLEFIHNIDPNIQTSWTAADTPTTLLDCTEIWIQEEGVYNSTDPSIHQQIDANGDRHLLYNNRCMIIDIHYSRIRSFYWFLWNADPTLDGYYFYAVNSWAYFADLNKDPWNNPTYHTANTNGGGYVFYPHVNPLAGNRLPYVNSIRWELNREGAEDFEYLYLLGNVLAAAKSGGGDPDEIAQAESLMECAKQIAYYCETYWEDEDLLYMLREAIAESIIALQ